MLSADGGGSDSAGKFKQTCNDNNREWNPLHIFTEEASC